MTFWHVLAVLSIGYVLGLNDTRTRKFLARVFGEDDISELLAQRRDRERPNVRDC